MKTFKEWREAVTANCRKLEVVEDYLNEKGKERLQVFRALDEISEFSNSAEDVLEFIDRTDGLIFNAPEAASPIRALYRIAEREEVDNRE